MAQEYFANFHDIFGQITFRRDFASAFSFKKRNVGVKFEDRQIIFKEAHTIECLE